VEAVLKRSIRILVVEDHAPFRDFVRSVLEDRSELQIIDEVADGIRAVQKAQELRPDLILLDIGLPMLNGIGAAHRIRQLSPTSKILFVTANRSWEVAEEVVCSGFGGYVVKSDAASDLLPAVEAVLQGKSFVSPSLIQQQKVKSSGRHEAGFYSDDRWFREDVSQFIGAALKTGNAAIVAATELHRSSLLSSLRAYGLDIGAAIEEGRYIALDAADVLSTFMVDGMPDPIPFAKGFGDLILKAAAVAKVQHPRVAIVGECAHLLMAEGNTEAAIRMEKLGNQLVKTYDVDILCGYSLHRFRDMMNAHIYQTICAEHSAVHSR
jgi:DNA-binding NarL/FixJ family response regulator